MKPMTPGRVTLAILLATLVSCSTQETTPKKPQPAPAKATPTASEITVLSFGGTFADAQRVAYFDPYEKATGTRVQDASYNGEYGKLKAMVQSGNVIWDVVDIESSALVRGKNEGLFERLDYDVIDAANHIPQAFDDYGIGADIYSVSLAFNIDSFPAGAPQPHTWSDFWDVKKFPGPRSLKKDPRFTLEAALMADGVPMDELYASGGLDVDRAFKSLSRIKPFISVWWTTGAQPVQMLADGEVALASAFGARVWLAKNREGKRVELTWNQGIVDIEYFAVLRGAPRPTVSMDFIRFASLPAQQAAFTIAFPLGPANAKAFEFIDEAAAAEINTHPDNLRQQVFINSDWWAKHEEELAERFNQWLVE